MASQTEPAIIVDLKAKLEQLSKSLQQAQESINQIDEEIAGLQRQRRSVLDNGIETQGRHKQILELISSYQSPQEENDSD